MLSNTTRYRWNEGNAKGSVSLAEYMQVEQEIAEHAETERIQREQLRKREAVSTRRTVNGTEGR